MSDFRSVKLGNLLRYSMLPDSFPQPFKQNRSYERLIFHYIKTSIPLI